MTRILSITLILIFSFDTAYSQVFYKDENGKLSLTLQGASHLASLPLKCLDKNFPFKPWYVITDSSFYDPRKIHPAFCGCFDWHSCVHGHWLLAVLLKQFPQMLEADSIQSKLKRHLSSENIRKELALFKGDNKSFERPYGWGWILQLQNELLSWNNPLGKELSNNLHPLSDFLANEMKSFVTKLQYPVREPEHYNIAFCMCQAWDYAVTVNDSSLKHSIKQSALRFFMNDVNCPADYEPGGFDFLSPCLEEADLMQRILSKNDFNSWLNKFLPDLYSKPEDLFKVGEVNDPADGKLVHLYGLNFSRSWCLYNISSKMPADKSKPVRDLALRHLKYSLPHVVSGNYEGEHWLATFAVLALKCIRN